jgi:hypothetical protein
MRIMNCAKCERAIREGDEVKAGQAFYHIGCAANTWIRPRVHEFSEGAQPVGKEAE